MSTDEEREARAATVAREATAALTRHLDERAVAIVAIRDGQPRDLASGTCIRIADRYLVATVAHFVREYTAHETFLVTQREPQYDFVPIASSGFRGGLPADRLDVAWLELQPVVATGLRREFIDVGRVQCGRSRIGRDLAVVYGFPSEKRILGDESLQLQPVGLLTFDLESRPKDALDDIDLFLEYRKDRLLDRDGRRIPSHEPAGMSGGGIWAVEVNTAGVWSSESARMVGIQHAWMRWQYLKGTQIQHWLQMVREDIPELDSVISVVLPIRP